MVKQALGHSDSVRGTRFSVRRTLLLVVLISAVLIALSAYEDAQQSRTLAEADTLRYSREAAVGIDGFFGSTRQMLLGASLAPAVSRQDSEAVTSMLGGLLKANPQYANVWATRADGWNYANPLPDPEGKPIYVGDRQYFKDAMAGGVGVESIPDSRQSPNRFAVVISLPVRGEDGSINGTVQAGFALPPIEEVLSKVSPPSGSSITLLDNDGYVLARYPSPEEWIGRRIDDTPLWQEMKANGSGVSENSLGESRGELAAFTATSLAPWKVVVTYPLEAVYRSVLESALRLVLLLGLPALAVVYLAWRLGNLAVEKAEAGETIRRQEQFLSALIEHSPVGIAVVEGQEHRFRLANPAYRAIPGATEVPMVGRTFAEVFPSPAGAALPMMDEANATGETVSVREYRADVGPGREETFWNVDTVPLPGLDGQTQQHLILAQEVTQQVRARVDTEHLLERAQQSERLYRSLFTSMSAGFVLARILRDESGVPVDLVYLDFNPTYQEATGFSPDSHIGMTMSRLLPESLSFWLGITNQILANGHPVRLERYSQKFDRWVDVVAYSPGEDLIAVLMDDITERKKVEEMLRAERAKLEAIVENLDVGVIIVDSAGTVLSMNSAALTIHGFASPAEMYTSPEQSASAFEMHYLDGRPMPSEQRPTLRALRGDFFSDLEVHIADPRTDRHWIGSWSAAPVRDSHGETQFLVFTVQDITERKRTEEARRESEDRLRRAQEIAHLGSWELDLVHNRLTWSDEVYRLFGLQPQEFGATYDAFLERVHPDDRAAVDAAYSGSLRENRDTYEIEHRVVRKPTGEIRFVHEKCEHFRDAAGRIIRSVGMVHDITERKEVEAERERLLAAEHEARSLAESAVKIRDEFISIAAHELKTPVTSLQGYAQLTLRELGKTGSVQPERLGTSMQRIEQQSKRLTRLTEQLLNLSRLQSRKLTLSKERVHLSSLAQRVIADIHLAHPTRVIELRIGGPDSVLLDPLRIEQVLVNLIDNAIKFSPPDSRIGVDLVESDPSWVEVSVRDRGMGIPEEKRAHVFERFYQAHVERHAGGMGIGLFVSREIVEMHGGTISVEQPEDGGSRFVVRLPRRHEAATEGDSPAG